MFIVYRSVNDIFNFIGAYKTAKEASDVALGFKGAMMYFVPVRNYQTFPS